LRPYC
jgi:hypothetical protein